MRLMTIFELAAKTLAERDAIQQRAAKDTDNIRLPAEARQHAAAILANLVRVSKP